MPRLFSGLTHPMEILNFVAYNMELHEINSRFSSHNRFSQLCINNMLQMFRTLALYLIVPLSIISSLLRTRSEKNESRAQYFNTLYLTLKN